MRPRRLTLEQIGERAGVSRSTVSRVLNDHPDVRAEVRARVEAVIAETGFQPNQAARALVSQRTGLIGLVMLTEVDELFGDPYYSALVSGIQEGCAQQGLIFSIFPVQSARGGPDALTRQIAEGFVDGVIATAGPDRDVLITALRDRGIPLVAIGHPHDTTGLMRVDVENRIGAAGAVRHLIAHGHQRIAYIGPTDDFLYGAERADGYHDALAEAGREVDQALIARERSSTSGGIRAARAVLAARPDAIFAATDQMADGAYRALAEAGAAVPDDVAVVGFDGLPRGPVLDPALTTVAQPVGQVGRRAVAMLAGDHQPIEILLPTELRLGTSCGCPTAR